MKPSAQMIQLHAALRDANSKIDQLNEKIDALAEQVQQLVARRKRPPETEEPAEPELHPLANSSFDRPRKSKS